MKKLLNTLYVTTEDAYLSLEGENVVVNLGDEQKRPFPLHTLNEIVCFTYRGASPALMGKCSSYNIPISFYTSNGKYLATVGSSVQGNVYLRRTQYRVADDELKSLGIARNFITGKLYNAKYVLLRYARDHEMQVDVDKLRASAERIHAYMLDASAADSMDTLRGVEGNAAAEYFGCFGELILYNRDAFSFNGRSRRPPLDRVNALLSFAYSLLSNDCAAALRGVGLDPYVGFMHTDRPGRESLGLDLVEELRPVMADRFVLGLINNRMIKAADFDIQESGAVLMTDKCRKTFLSAWQDKKREELTHPFLNEKIQWGLVPHVQAMLLARYLRGDLDEYPPFFWK